MKENTYHAPNGKTYTFKTERATSPNGDCYCEECGYPFDAHDSCLIIGLEFPDDIHGFFCGFNCAERGIQRLKDDFVMLDRFAKTEAEERMDNALHGPDL